MTVIIITVIIAADAQPEIFQGRGGFMKLGHFDKHFLKKLRMANLT